MKTFDEWMKGNEDKPINSLEDAIAILAANAKCYGVSCYDCIVKAYDHKGGNCKKRRKEAASVLFNIAVCNISDKKGLEVQEVIKDKLLRDGGTFQNPMKLKDTCNGTCSTCKESFEHSAGIRFCKSWHNFTHETGFCYRYDPVIMEEQDPPEIKIKVAVDK